MSWQRWKKSFDVWENATAQHLERWLKSPSLLVPAGGVLSTAMRVKAMTDEVAAAWWSAVGLPTKRDQERAMHALNQLQSRLFDLEEKLAALEHTKTTPRPRGAANRAQRAQ